MTELLRTTLRLYKERPYDLEAFRLLHRIHDEQHLSYAQAIVTAINDYYGDKHPDQPCFDEKQVAMIRAIVREELSSTPVSIGTLLQAMGQQPAPQSLVENTTADDTDLDDMLDSFGS